MIVDCLTSSLAPLKMWNAAPNSEVTVEVAELCPEAHPFTSYNNHLYVYPQNLAFDSQKMFTRARNIACTVQLRDDDAENAQPITVRHFLLLNNHQQSNFKVYLHGFTQEKVIVYYKL